jgi:hypothetical protein
MLHAVNHRKAKLQVFRAPGLRVPLEDVVSSTVFGALMFMPANQRLAIVNRLWRDLGLSPFAETDDVQIDFWPKRPIDDSKFRTRYVEPDIVVSSPSGRLTLVEIKWGAQLSDLELSSQWLSLEEKRRKTSDHLLLVLEPRDYDRGVAACRNVLKGRLVTDWPLRIHPWRRFADVCRHLAVDVDLDAGARLWARQVHAFLRREDPDGLAGWENLELRSADVCDWRIARPGWPGSASDAGSWRYQ